MALPSAIILRGTRASQPAATAVAAGSLFCVTDEGRILERSTGAAWESYSSAAGAGDVVASGTLTASRLMVGAGTTIISALGSLGTTTTLLHGNAVGAPTFGAVVEADITLADNTTNNASTTAHGLLKKLSNISTEFMNGAGNWATPAGGGVIQVKNTQTGAVATGTTIIPNDDTIPQNTEGDQYMSLAITPTSATNVLQIDVSLIGSNSVADAYVIVALFQDATANALAVAATWVETATAYGVVTFSHYMVSGTTAATTFKVRAGAHVASTMTFNGQVTARRFGGVMASSITITEMVP